MNTAMIIITCCTGYLWAPSLFCCTAGLFSKTTSSLLIPLKTVLWHKTNLRQNLSDSQDYHTVCSEQFMIILNRSRRLVLIVACSASANRVLASLETTAWLLCCVCFNAMNWCNRRHQPSVSVTLTQWPKSAVAGNLTPLSCSWRAPMRLGCAVRENEWSEKRSSVCVCVCVTPHMCVREAGLLLWSCECVLPMGRIWVSAWQPTL